MIFLYNLFITLYGLAIRLAATWNAKAAQWVNGRKNNWKALEAMNLGEQETIWVHAASAGEFEQAKPVIEKLKAEYPSYQVLVSFFSPSGYGAGLKYGKADHICYLPLDTAANAARFYESVRPKLVLWVKYDYWHHHLNTLHQKGVPVLLFSALFRETSPFFTAYGGFYRRILTFFRHLFVQDSASAALLQKHGISHVTRSGDTRFDRVAAITGHFREVPYLSEFCGSGPVIVAGSTWPDDERRLAEYLKGKEQVKLVVAPHEITVRHIQFIQSLFRNTLLYSQLPIAFEVAPFLQEAGPAADNRENVQELFRKAQVLIIDNVGMLSRLYHYATVTYIGGGFKAGIHNTLEAAVYGKPVVFGPNYAKFREARDLIARKAAFSIRSEEELKEVLSRLLGDPAVLRQAGAASAAYVAENRGATDRILDYIQENRLLTR